MRSPLPHLGLFLAALLPWPLFAAQAPVEP